jgi:hypothetical protein
MPGGPAAQEGRLHPGDKILSVSHDGNEAKFISTENMPPEQMTSLLEGEPGSSIAMKALLRSNNENETEVIIRLQRAARTTIELPTGAIGYGFLRTNQGWSSLNLSLEDMAKLRHVSFEEWSQITKGMTTNNVVRIIGEPLRVDVKSDNEVWWRYGWLVDFGNFKAEPYFATLRITDGAILEDFGVEQRPEEPIKFEILSKVSQQR